MVPVRDRMYYLDVAFSRDDDQAVDRAVYGRRRHRIALDQQAHELPQNARLLPAIQLRRDSRTSEAK